MSSCQTIVVNELKCSTKYILTSTIFLLNFSFLTELVNFQKNNEIIIKTGSFVLLKPTPLFQGVDEDQASCLIENRICLLNLHFEKQRAIPDPYSYSGFILTMSRGQFYQFLSDCPGGNIQSYIYNRLGFGQILTLN